MKVKKTSQEIKASILDELRKSPKTIAEISQSIKSNWITTEKTLKELSEEAKVRELLSTEKKKVYQLITGDTYFDIPITEIERKRFRSLFCLIMQVFKEKNISPTKTFFAKTAVEVIKNPESGLSDLPVVWYLYGMIPLMIADPLVNYQEDIVLEKKNKINEIIGCYISKNCNNKSKQIQIQQHKVYNEELYQLADRFLERIESNWKDEEILSLLNEFFIACPIDNEFPEVFESIDRFISTVGKLKHFSKLQDHKKEILLTFDSLWKYIATYKMYKSLSLLKRFPDNKMILEFYVGNILESRMISFQESFSELESVYLSKLTDKDISLTPEAAKVREIMDGWTGED